MDVKFDLCLHINGFLVAEHSGGRPPELVSPGVLGGLASQTTPNSEGLRPPDHPKFMRGLRPLKLPQI